MTEKEIMEGNKLIGEFMGKNFKNPMNYFYDKKWDELMPVVEKIGTLSYNQHQGRFRPVVERFLENDIENIWLQIVGFIKWYNSQNK